MPEFGHGITKSTDLGWYMKIFSFVSSNNQL